MLKRYIKNIVKEQIDDIRLENTFKQSGSKTYWEGYFKTQLNYTESIIKGRDKEIYRLREKLKWLEHDNIILKDLYEQEKDKNYKTLESEELKQENEKLKKEISELELLNEKLNKENKELLLTPANTITEELDILKSENEKLKKENEQLKNYYCHIVIDNDGKIDSFFNQELEQENEKLNGDKEVLKVALEESKNYVAYLEKETKKLNEKLDGIKYTIKKQRLSALTYEKLKDTFMLIERYIKES